MALAMKEISKKRNPRSTWDSNDLKSNEYVNSMVGNANRILGMLKRTFEIKEPGLWKELYVSLVRPNFEYAV